MTGKQRIREILKDFVEAGMIEPYFDEVDYKIALDSIEEVLKEVLGEDYVFDRPKEDYLPNTYIHLKAKNELRSEQLGRWSDK